VPVIVGRLIIRTVVNPNAQAVGGDKQSRFNLYHARLDYATHWPAGVMPLLPCKAPSEGTKQGGRSPITLTAKKDTDSHMKIEPEKRAVRK
jgi:hypothetical protein